MMMRAVRKCLALAALVGLLLPPGLGAGPMVPSGSRAAAAAAAATASIVLITGDCVHVDVRPDGSQDVGVEPGPGREGVGFLQVVKARGGREEISVIPDDAAPLLARGLLDPDLFNVTKLVRQGFGKHSREGLPVILTFEASRSAGAQSLSAATDIHVAHSLPSINAAAVAADEKDTAAVWTWLTGGGAASAPATAAADKAIERSSAFGVTKVWLDGRAKPMLDESGPQIGLPVARQAGLTGAGVTVAVLDSGIKTGHPDLAGRVVASRDFSDSLPSADDDAGHGTHVAGIIAGSGAASSGRYQGMAPEASLLNGKVCHAAGWCSESDIIAGMEWAAPQARVVNMSLGGEATDGSDPLSQALNRLTAQYGTLFVVAAGNFGEPVSVGSPASADAALAVGSVTKQDTLSPFSSRGPRLGDHAIKPEIVAPGSLIVAARAAGTPVGDVDPVGESYTRLSGTSMATPHVAGAAALLAQAHPDWAAPQLKAALMSTATPIAGVDIYDQGAGRVDLARAASQAVFAITNSIDFGLVRWPHEGPAVTKTVSYRNEGATPVSFQLSVSFPGRTTPVPAGVFAVNPLSLTVPAGGTAEASVTLTPSAVPEDLRGAMLVATSDTGAVVRTPVGVLGEPESYDLTLTAVGHAGAVGYAAASATNLHTGASEFTQRFDAQGNAVWRLPKGTYDVTALVSSAAPDLPAPGHELTLFGEPEVVLNADASLMLDARSALPLTARIDDPAAVPRWAILSLRSGSNAGTGGLSTAVMPNVRTFAVPTRRTVTGRPYLFRYEPVLGVPAAGTPPWPIVDATKYNLVFFETGRIPDRLDFAARRRELAAVHEIFHVQGVTPDKMVVTRGNFVYAGGHGPLMTLSPRTVVPSQQTQYFTAREVEWVHRLRVWDQFWAAQLEQQESRLTRYRPGTRRSMAWSRAPLGPAFAYEGRQFTRIEGYIAGSIGLFSGSQRGHVTFSAEGVSGTTELSRDGAPLAASHRLCGGYFKVPSGPATYTLRCTANRVAPHTVLGTHAEATWTFHDSGAAGQSLPLLAVRATGEVDELDRAPAGRPFFLVLRVDHQAGAEATPITDLDLEVSFDDGAAWKRVPVLHVPNSDRALALVRHPAEAGFVSLRASATDSHGNSVQQTMIRAYQTVAP